jgi:hypothetical protein
MCIDVISNNHLVRYRYVSSNTCWKGSLTRIYSTDFGKKTFQVLYDVE